MRITALVLVLSTGVAALTAASCSRTDDLRPLELSKETTLFDGPCDERGVVRYVEHVTIPEGVLVLEGVIDRVLSNPEFVSFREFREGLPEPYRPSRFASSSDLNSRAHRTGGSENAVRIAWVRSLSSVDWLQFVEPMGEPVSVEDVWNGDGSEIVRREMIVRALLLLADDPSLREKRFDHWRAALTLARRIPERSIFDLNIGLSNELLCWERFLRWHAEDPELIRGLAPPITEIDSKIPLPDVDRALRHHHYRVLADMLELWADGDPDRSRDGILQVTNEFEQMLRGYNRVFPKIREALSTVAWTPKKRTRLQSLTDELADVTHPVPRVNYEPIAVSRLRLIGIRAIAIDVASEFSRRSTAPQVEYGELERWQGDGLRGWRWHGGGFEAVHVAPAER